MLFSPLRSASWGGLVYLTEFLDTHYYATNLDILRACPVRLLLWMRCDQQQFWFIHLIATRLHSFCCCYVTALLCYHFVDYFDPGGDLLVALTILAIAFKLLVDFDTLITLLRIALWNNFCV